MSPLTLALLVASLVGLARVPWIAGRSARAAGVAHGCGRGRCPTEADCGGRRTGVGPAGSAHERERSCDGHASCDGLASCDGHASCDGVRPPDAERSGSRGAGLGGGADRDPDLGVDVVLVLDLLDVAVASGAALPRAVHAVGEAVGGVDGAALTAAARALVLGAGWAGAWSGAPAHLGPVVQCLADSWVSGAAPGPALRAAADEVNRGRRRAAREAAGRLGVRLVLPLGLCLLPAFVLLGLVPVVLSLAGGLLG